jgi:hypothetical protein
MINDAIRLSIKFFNEVKGFGKDANGKVQAPEDYKVHVMKNIEQLLAGGTSVKEIETLMNRYKSVHPSPQEAYMVDDILSYFKVKADKKEVKRDPNNLLEPGKFYYHTALQIAPPPPTIMQRDDGTFYSSYEDEEFYLEMKEVFTLSDLVDYFYKVMEIDVDFKERDMGAFKHILKSYDIDTVLYMINEARVMSEDRGKSKPTSPFDIRDYADDAIAVLEDRKNSAYMEGLDRVIPRTSK